MTTINPETGVLWPPGFAAAIEAASASASAGADEQEQLAAGIVAYCTFMAAVKMSRTIHHKKVGTTPAQAIGQEHAAK